MKKHLLSLTVSVVLTVFLIPACVSTPPTAAVQVVVVTATSAAPPVFTHTPDPCAAENLEAEVQKIHKFMREFDDASSLAASRPQEQLADAIADLQRIRRDAEDQLTPICLATLKTYQIAHMNSVINTLIAFMGGAAQTSIDQGIALARDQHDKYTIELARVLGLPVGPATQVLPASQTPTSP
jgi:heme/copper-type cytochrome/quinol oxidase subunit 4